MDQNGLLLERYSGGPPGRLHEGQIITVRQTDRLSLFLPGVKLNGYQN